MRYTVQVKPNAKTASVVRTAGGSLAVRVDSPAREGRANGRLAEILAVYFRVPKSAVRIIRGESGRAKVVEIV